RRAYHRRLPGEPRLRHERGEEHDHGSQASHIASDETEIGYPGAPAVPDSSGGPSVSRATASSGSRAYMGPTRTKRAPRNYFRSARFHWWAVKESNRSSDPSLATLSLKLCTASENDFAVVCRFKSPTSLISRWASSREVLITCWFCLSNRKVRIASARLAESTSARTFFAIGITTSCM